MIPKQPQVKPDSKSRVLLGRLTQKEAWLFENQAVLNQVKKGLQDSAARRVKSRGSFTKFIDDKK